MEVFRLHNKAFEALDGTGAALQGARWNPRGWHVVYASRTFEGAILEQLVHAGIGRLPKNRIASKIHLPDAGGVEVVEQLEANAWEDQLLTQAIGLDWLEARTSLMLEVPSAVARPFGRNVLINPRHPRFTEVRVAEAVAVLWDPRLTGQKTQPDSA